MPDLDGSPLGSIAYLLSGGTPSKAEPMYWGGPIPWLTPKDMGRWTGSTEETVFASAIGNGTRLAPTEASFIAVRGMSLHNEIRIVRSCTPLTFNQDIKAIVPREGTDSGFLYYALIAKKAELLDCVEAAGHGTGVLPTEKLRSLHIPRFDLHEQQGIAALLGLFDEKIDLNRRMNATLEILARAVFKDWFVDFGPTKEKAEGRAPIGFSSEVLELFPDALDESGMPFGWHKRSFGDLLSDNIGGDWGTDVPQGESSSPVFIIRGTDFQSVSAGEIRKCHSDIQQAKKRPSGY